MTESPMDFVKRVREWEERLTDTHRNINLPAALSIIETLVAERDAAMHMVKKWLYSHSTDTLGKPKACRCDLCTESHAAVAAMKGCAE